MKKLLTFMMLLCTAALASNEPVALHIYGPDCIAKNSHNVPYFMATSGFLNGRPLGWTWECKDLNGNTLDYIETDPYAREIKVDARQTSFILYARFRYESYEDHTERYSYASYQVNVGEPTFTISNIGSIHNGQFDTTITGVTTRVIHFNIDSDMNAVENGELLPDYLVANKRIGDDDDILTFRINHFPSYMDVRYIPLKLELPNYVIVYRNGSAQESGYLIPLGEPGHLQTIACWSSSNFGRILDTTLYVEGLGLGVGSVKISYNDCNGNLISAVADLRYRACADVSGRQPLLLNGIVEDMSFKNQLDGCEWSLFDESNSSFSSSDDYNAPAFAVDHNWDAIGHPFIVEEQGYGSPGNPIILGLDNKYHTSYAAFGGVREFFETNLWTLTLSLGGTFNDSVVLYYFSVPNTNPYQTWAALRSWSTTGTLPTWNMFYMKLIYGPILNHRGEVLFDYSSGLNYSPGPMKFMLNSND